MKEVLPGVYIGSVRDLEPKKLRRAGIKTIINLRTRKRDPAFDGIENIWIPLSASRIRRLTPDKDALTEYPELQRVIEAVRRARRRGNVLIHCSGGRVRSPFVGELTKRYINAD